MSTIYNSETRLAPDTTSRADHDIETDVEQILRASAIFSDRHVLRVTVRDGHVMLTGRLARHSDVPLATRLARSVPGVIAVHNWLDYVWTD